MATIAFGDVQGLLVRPYRYPIARYLLFHFGEEGPARGFLRRLIPRINTGAQTEEGQPEPLWNVLLSPQGLAATGLDRGLLEQFEPVFLEGPDAVSLGDFGASAPASWWGGRFATREIHGLVQISARTDPVLEETTEELRGWFREFGLSELIASDNERPLEGRALGGAKLHFGYTDGISHPDVRWGDGAELAGTVDFRNFVLGYANDRYPSSPFKGEAAELVRGSSYVVFRVIYQDVAGFEAFLGAQAPRLAPDRPPEEARELLAAKMLGRWRDGTPLVLSPDRPDPALTRSDNFAYATADPDGLRSPFSAHIRVVNPRDQALDARVAATPFGPVPKVLRRGLPYGPELTSSRDDGVDRGLIGIFLAAHIRFQIYTLTRWMKANNFSSVFRGRTNARDALFANRGTPGAASDFAIPTARGEVTLPGLPDFTRTRGTVFLLLPSLPTLRALTRQD